ncbi:MAG: hypothetical protein Q9M91_05660 [Candidatus Dojkabacteria bacterium]|nr:hypothetical protein [Candidatus Dojkabacteria bacterium]MDQ7021288.1 hypothetical protein [Candidatus Dojkabacteria bacterium]
MEIDQADNPTFDDEIILETSETPKNLKLITLQGDASRSLLDMTLQSIGEELTVEIDDSLDPSDGTALSTNMDAVKKISEMLLQNGNATPVLVMDMAAGYLNAQAICHLINLRVVQLPSDMRVIVIHTSEEPPRLELKDVKCVRMKAKGMYETTWKSRDDLIKAIKGKIDPEPEEVEA